MRALWKTLVVVVFLLVVVVVAGVVVIATVDPNDYKDLIAEKAKEATGRDLKLDGNIQLDLGWSPTLVVENVSFANAPWGSRPQMATLKRLEVQVELMPAIRGDYRVNKLIVEGLDLLAETDKQGAGNWVMGEPKPEPEKPSEPGELVIPVVRQVLIQDVKVTYRDGKSGQATVLTLDNLIAEAEDNDSPLKVDIAGNVDKTPFEAKGTFGAVNALVRGDKYPVDFAADLLGLKATAKGEVTGAAGGIDVSVKGADLNKTIDAVKGFVPDLKTADLPALGAFSVTAKLTGSADKMAVSDLNVAVGRPDFLALSATGGISDAVKVTGINIVAGVKASNLNKTAEAAKAFVPELAKVKLPPLGGLDAKATVLGSLKALSVSGIEVATGRDDFAAVTARGSIADALNTKGLDITVAVRGDELTKTLDQAQALAPELGAALGDKKLPAIGPFSLAATIKGGLDAMAVSGIDVNVGRAEQLLVTAKGAVADAIKAKGLALDVALQGADATPLARAFAGEGLKIPALRIVAKVSDPDGGYALDGLDAKVGRSDLSGNLAVKLAGERPVLNAKLASKMLDLDEIMPQQKGGKKAPAPAPAAKKGDGRVFPNDPLPVEGLKAADATVSFRGDAVKVNGTTLKDLSVDLSLQNGKLAVKPFSVVAGEGTIKGDVGLDASVAMPALAVNVDVAQLDYGKLLKDMDVTDLVRGKLDAKTNVTGQGVSVREIMAGLDGKLRVVTENGYINSKLLNVVSSDLAAALTFGDSKGDQDIRCGVVDFDIKKGQADARALVVETGGISVIGEGGIDLAQEKLDLSIDPKAKSVSLVKVAMIPVDVGGTLASPSVKPNVGAAAVGVVTGAVGTVTDVAKGGASGLGGLVKSVTGQGGGDTAAAGKAASVDQTDYCKLALAGEAVKRVAVAPAPAATTSEPPASKAAPATSVSPGATLTPPPKTESAPAAAEKPVEKAKEAVGDLGKKLDKGLKGLFK
ncbi:MAG: AsmA family protein [Hyphomicrobiales bacterium]|nr:AsmA family protein [Hyphomicrobiales bacterium]MCP5373923.1 AsmA family protein [Hyphomicrobiales bacterium]